MEFPKTRTGPFFPTLLLPVPEGEAVGEGFLVEVAVGPIGVGGAGCVVPNAHLARTHGVLHHGELAIHLHGAG